MKIPNDVRVSRELLEELLDAAKWKALFFTKASPYRTTIDDIVRRTKDLLAQPATAKVDQALSDFLNSIAVDGLPDYLGPDQLDGSDPLNHANPYDWFRWNGEFRPIGKYELCDVVLRSGEIISAIDPHEVEWDDGSVVAARYTPAAKLNGGQS